MEDAAHKFLDRGLLAALGAHAFEIAIAHLVRLFDPFVHTEGGVVFEVAVKMFVVHNQQYLTRAKAFYCGGGRKKRHLKLIFRCLKHFINSIMKKK